jgi:hypothetical protein
MQCDALLSSSQSRRSDRATAVSRPALKGVNLPSSSCVPVIRFAGSAVASLDNVVSHSPKPIPSDSFLQSWVSHGLAATKTHDDTSTLNTTLRHPLAFFCCPNDRSAGCWRKTKLIRWHASNFGRPFLGVTRQNKDFQCFVLCAVLA